MTKKLILHIGRPKTGSSALQHFLWANKSRLLRKHGVLYPESVMHHRASHKLALVFQSYLPAYRVVSDATPADIYGQMFRDAENSGANTIVASSENLFLVEPERVRQELPSNYDTKVICYVRRQDHVLASSLVQEIKTGAVDIDTNITDYVFNEERLSWLDYEAVLDRWSTAFGSTNIIVRVYKEPGTNWNIVEDFADVIGLGTDEFDIPKERINPSPTRDVLDFIRIINSCDELSDARKPVLRVPLLRASEHLGSGGGFDSHQMISASLRRKLLLRFEGSNATVAQKYLGRRYEPLFDATMESKVMAPAAYQGMDLDRFAYMVGSVLCSMQAKIDVLEGMVNKAKHVDPK